MPRIPAFLVFLFIATAGFSQTVNNKLVFEQGQLLGITVQLKTTVAQEAMGRAIDFDLEGSAIHSFKVTNATEDNSTLHHQVNEIGFKFDGMGQKTSFHSGNEKDLNGIFGKPVREMLGKTYDMIIDPSGKVLVIQPEKMEPVKWDDRFAIIASMLKDVATVVQPPAKGYGCFFKVLPDKETARGESWTETLENESGKYATTYTLADINDSTILVDLSGVSTTITKAEMMGNETVTTMNNKTTGRIILDRATGLVREKNFTTESNGSTEAMGNTLPVTSKTTISIKVKKEK